MPSDSTTGLKTWQPVITSDGSSTLRHPTHKETYHSTFGAVTESNIVFLQNSGVAARLQAGIPTRILEIGFGTGLNFLVTADAAERAASSVEYVAVEIDPVADSLLADLLTNNFPNQRPLINKSIDAVRTFTRQSSSPADNQPVAAQDPVVLTDFIAFQLIIGDALTCDFGSEQFNAVYLDAFSPKNNPDLWATRFLKKLRPALADDALLASYCVNRRFRDSLTEAGYDWRKVEGPPGKREVLIAQLNREPLRD